MSEIDELFCPKCGRLKRRCICFRESIRQRNLRLLENIPDADVLKPVFDCEDEIVYFKIFTPFHPEPTESLDFLPENIAKILKGHGIHALYPFQKEAIEKLRKGENVVITAPTGFGKTEAFIIPMIERVANERCKGLVFYPTKALARDQELKIRDYALHAGISAVRFDGDSGKRQREAVLSGEAEIILTNPDMVDYHLRNTPAFRRIAKEIGFIAVDELHTYTGLLGSNMHWLIKRLSRFTDFQIACASATLSNAKEFAEELFDRNFVHVHGNHRKAELAFIMRYTPSIYASIKDVVRTLIGRKLLIFGNSYRSVETINWILKKEGIDAAVHKSGLPKRVREKVEEAFREGRIRIVVATPTLELGIDIGDVDAVISELVPYSQFLQRVGRAGRKGQKSIGILMLRADDSISTYYRANPEEYLKENASGYVERKNEEVMRYQIVSMCMEKPAKKEEIETKIAERLLRERLLTFNGEKYFATEKGKRFVRKFNMRGIGDSVRMYCDGELIGERVLPVAVRELYPGSIVLHNGERYRCVEVNLRKLRAELEIAGHGEDVTEPLYASIPKITETEEEIEKPVNAVYCNLEITISVYGYIERSIFSKEKKDYFYLDEPISYSFPTKGFVFSAPFPEEEDYDDYYAGTFHALEHVLIEASDALTGGGSREMGGISTPDGDIFVYDAVFGGSGLSKLLFNRLRRAFEVAYEILSKCECKRVDGCPRCTYSYQCGNNNQPLNRIGAMKSAELVLVGKKRETDWYKYTDVTDFQYFPG
jgi:DEAD/DEAH box helicase domain-containing protein